MRGWSPRIDLREWFPTLATDWRVWREATPNAAAARRALTTENAGSISGSPCGPIFWLALAHLQWLDGCLEPMVRRRALAYAQRGPDKVEWLSPLSLTARRQDFGRLAELLQRPQPQPKPFGEKPLPPPPARPGDVLLVRARGRVTAALVVVGRTRARRRLLAEAVAFAWTRDEAPTAKSLTTLKPLMRGKPDPEAPLETLVRPAGATRWSACTTLAITDLDEVLAKDPGVRLDAGLVVRVKRRGLSPEFMSWSGARDVVASMHPSLLPSRVSPRAT